VPGDYYGTGRSNQKPAGYTISGDPWYDTGTGGGQEPYSAANYPKGSNYQWAQPYSKTTGGLQTGGQNAQPKYNVGISKTVLPKGVNLPTFAGPTWDEREGKKRARRIAAPGLRALDMKVQSAMSRYYENPNVRRMVLRDTLAGYGIGMSNILAKAESQGQQEYAQDYARQYSEAVNTYTRGWQEAMSKASQISTSIPTNQPGEVQDILAGTSKYTKR
jgi:hypothetical protein